MLIRFLAMVLLVTWKTAGGFVEKIRGTKLFQIPIHLPPPPPPPRSLATGFHLPARGGPRLMGIARVPNMFPTA